MLFTSLVFLFVFLPSLLLLYYLIPKRLRNNLLLFYSFLFYAWGGVSYSIILLGSVWLNYLFIKQIEKQNEHCKTWLISGLMFNVLLIVIFKYLDFIIGNVKQYNPSASNDVELSSKRFLEILKKYFDRSKTFLFYTLRAKCSFCCVIS